MVFNWHVWVAILVSITVVVLSMLFSDKVFLGSTNWLANAKLVISRNCPDATNMIPQDTYKGFFIITWTLAVLFLHLGYDACLKSTLSLPRVERKIENAEDLANQHEIPWVFEEDHAFHSYTLDLDPSKKETKHLSTIADLGKKLRLDSEWYGACYTTDTKKDNQGGNSILSLDLTNSVGFLWILLLFPLYFPKFLGKKVEYWLNEIN